MTVYVLIYNSINNIVTNGQRLVYTFTNLYMQENLEELVRINAFVDSLFADLLYKLSSMKWKTHISSEQLGGFDIRHPEHTWLTTWYAEMFLYGTSPKCIFKGQS